MSSFHCSIGRGIVSSHIDPPDIVMFEEEVGLFHDLSVTALSSIVWLGLWGGHVTCTVPGNR